MSVSLFNVDDVGRPGYWWMREQGDEVEGSCQDSAMPSSSFSPLVKWVYAGRDSRVTIVPADHLKILTRPKVLERQSRSCRHVDIDTL